MSWLAKSLANLRIAGGDDDDDHDGGIESGRDGTEKTKSDAAAAAEEEESSSLVAGEDAPRGVKEDLSEITKTLTRQLWGVASFLAPAPSSSPSASAGDTSPPSDRVLDRSEPSAASRESDYSEMLDSPRIAGIRGDLAEFGGRFRTGISKLSGNKAVSEISKIASSFLPFGSDEDDEEEDLEGEHGSGGAIGVTEEVLAFARNISMHPETWLDFPLFLDDEDSDDFYMSDAQQEHALAVERLAPRLAALRIELCPSHMSEGCFWKIYFVLLHSRLNKRDAELLLTPQIVEARALWLQELQNRTKPAPDMLGRGTSSYGSIRNRDRPSTGSPGTTLPGEQVTTFSVDYENIQPKTTALEESSSRTDFETEKHPVVTTEINIIDKSVVEEHLPMKTKDIASDERHEDDGDDWLEEETTEMGDSRITTIPIENDEDVSFSDLEEEDDKVRTSTKTATSVSKSQAKESRGWVQLSKGSGNSIKDNPEAKDSNEWSDLEDIDVV